MELLLELRIGFSYIKKAAPRPCYLKIKVSTDESPDTALLGISTRHTAILEGEVIPTDKKTTNRTKSKPCQTKIKYIKVIKKFNKRFIQTDSKTKERKKIKQRKTH